MAALLTKNGFEVISCDGKQPGCVDLNREAFLGALAGLETEVKTPIWRWYTLKS